MNRQEKKQNKNKILGQSMKLKTNNYKQSKINEIIKASSLRKSIASNNKHSKQSNKIEMPYNIKDLIAPYFNQVIQKTHKKKVSLNKRTKVSLNKGNNSWKQKASQLSNTVPVKYSKSRLLQFPFDSIKFKPASKNTHLHRIEEIKEFSQTYNDGFYFQYDQPETIQNQATQHQTNQINSFNQRISRYSEQQLKNKILSKNQLKQNNLNNLHNTKTSDNIKTTDNIQFKDKNFKESLMKLFRLIDQQKKKSISYSQLNKVKIPQQAFYFLGIVFQKIKQKQLTLSEQKFIRQCIVVYKRSSNDDIQWFIKAMSQIKVCQNLTHSQNQCQKAHFVKQNKLDNREFSYKQKKQSQSDPDKSLISFRKYQSKDIQSIEKDFRSSQKKDSVLKNDSLYYSNRFSQQQMQEIPLKNKTGQIKKNIMNKPDDLRDKIYAKLQAMKSNNPIIDKENNFAYKKQKQHNDNYYFSNPLGQQDSRKINIVQKKHSQQNSGQKWQSSTKAIDKSYSELQKLQSQFKCHKQSILQKQKQRQNYFKEQLNQIETKVSQQNQKIDKFQEEESRIVKVFGNNHMALQDKVKPATSSNFYQRNVDRLGTLASFKRSVHLPTTYVPKSDDFSLRQVEMSLPLKQKQQKVFIDRKISNEQVNLKKLDKIDLLSQKIEDYLKKNANKIQVSKNFTTSNIGKFNKI